MNITLHILRSSYIIFYCLPKTTVLKGMTCFPLPWTRAIQGCSDTSLSSFVTIAKHLKFTGTAMWEVGSSVRTVGSAFTMRYERSRKFAFSSAILNSFAFRLLTKRTFVSPLLLPLGWIVWGDGLPIPFVFELFCFFVIDVFSPFALMVTWNELSIENVLWVSTYFWYSTSTSTSTSTVAQDIDYTTYNSSYLAYDCPKAKAGTPPPIITTSAIPLSRGGNSKQEWWTIEPKFTPWSNAWFVLVSNISTLDLPSSW